MQTQSEYAAANGGQNSKNANILRHQLIVCDQDTFVKYVKEAKQEFKNKLFPDNDEDTVVEIKTYMIWYDQVLKPSSTRFIKAKIQEMKK